MSVTNQSQIIEGEQLNDLESKILDKWQAFDIPIDQYRWPWETARWHELVFCLLLHSGQPKLDTDMARSLTNFLATIDMLRIERLAEFVSAEHTPDFAQPDLALFVELLMRADLELEQAKRVVALVCQVAAGIQQHFGGKAQRYLRQYGQAMLDDLGKYFPLNNANEADVRYAFTHWLQNVLDMPLALSEPAVSAFCKQQGVTTEELISIADRLDLNLALLDDMIATSENGSHQEEQT